MADPCTDRIRPGAAVDRPRQSDPLARVGVAGLVAIAHAAIALRDARFSVGHAGRHLLDVVDEVLAPPPDPPADFIPGDIPAGPHVAVASCAPASLVALRHAWRCGNRLAAAEALAAVFAGAETPLGRLDAADRALGALTPPTGPWGPR